MTDPKRCCSNPIQFVIVYANDEIISVCLKHSKEFEYRRNAKLIFDYVTKKELINHTKNLAGNSNED